MKEMSIFCTRNKNGEWSLNSPHAYHDTSACNDLGKMLGIDKKTNCFQIHIHPEGETELSRSVNGFILVDPERELYAKVAEDDEFDEVHFLNGKRTGCDDEITEILCNFNLEGEDLIKFDIWEWVEE